jgi:hypothetical protein
MSDMSQFKAWMRIATPEEQRTLAEAAGTSRHYLYHLANDRSRYGRSASADLAGRIEAASRVLCASNPKLPIIRRTDLCEACRSCEFARKCLGDQLITESEFRVISD